MSGITVETTTMIGVTFSGALLHVQEAYVTNGEQHTTIDLSPPASLTLHFSDADALAGAALVMQNAADALRRTIAANIAAVAAPAPASVGLMDPSIVPPIV